MYWNVVCLCIRCVPGGRKEDVEGPGGDTDNGTVVPHSLNIPPFIHPLVCAQCGPVDWLCVGVAIGGREDRLYSRITPTLPTP